MSWVQSLQSKLDEVQSSIDARLEKKLSEKRFGASKLPGVKHTKGSLPASSQDDITREDLAKSETATKANVTGLVTSELAAGHPVFVDDEDEQGVAWPSLAATTSAEVAMSSQNISPAAAVEELVEEPELSSGYDDVDTIIRAQLMARSCDALLARAQAGAAELELRWADCSDSRAARTTGRKTVLSKMRAWRAGDLDEKDLASAVNLELEACGRHGRELEEALARAIETCGRPVTAAHSKLGEVRVALNSAEMTIRASKREEAESVERHTIGLSQVARDEHARATRVVWRLARSGLRAKGSERARVMRRLTQGRGGTVPELDTSSSGCQADAEDTMTLRAALLVFRSQAFESHRIAAGQALKAAGMAVTCRERVAALANKYRVPEIKTSTDGIDAVKRVMAKLSAETTVMLDAMIPSDSARRRHDELVRKLAEVEAESARLRQVASKAEREAALVSEQLAEACAEVERLKKLPNSAQDLQVAKAEAATASRRAAEASAVATEALAQLDRERANRKSRELSALKNLNEQLRSARSEARASRESVAEVGARLESEQDAHRAAAAVTDTLIAGADGLRAQIAQLAEKMVAAAAARREAEHRARDLDNRLGETKRERDAIVDSLRSNLQLAIDARDQAIQELSNHLAAARQQQQPKYQLHRKSSLDLEANSNHQQPGSPKKHAASKVGGRRISGLLRILFVVYALALHVLAYISFHRCEYVAISKSIPDVGVKVIARRKA